MKKFEHVKTKELVELEVEMRETGRYYKSPQGIFYPSITTILGHASDHTWLEEWKNRVGDEEVRRVSGQATRRGTAVHDLAEKYLNNDPYYKKGHMPSNIASFGYIKPFLDENLEKVGGLEVPLYSHKLRAAGRCDCFGVWGGKWSVLDFKTSKREKKRDDIHSYFMQKSAYAWMIYELTGIMCPQIITVMTVDDSKPLIFIEKTKDWLPKFIELRETVNL